MADAIDFLYNRPIGRTKAGEEIFADMQFLQALLAVRDRTGGTARNFIADALAAAAAAEITADGKITSVWQNDPPTVGGFSEGDLWFDTNDGNKCYQLRSGAWVNAQDSAIGTAIGAAAGAQATADTKIVTFYQTSAPTAGEVGDLWHDTDDAQRRTYRWSGSAWVHITDQTAFNTAAAITGQGPGATATAEDVLNVNTPTAYMNVDAEFRSAWTSGSYPPLQHSWGNWALGTRNSKVAGRIGPNAVRFTCPDTSDTGWVCTPGFGGTYGHYGPGWYVVEVDVYLISGNLKGAGVYGGSFDAAFGAVADYYLDFNVLADISGTVNNGASPATGRMYSYRRVMNFSGATTRNFRIYAMANWGGFTTPGTVKTIEFHRCGIRPATASEKAAANAELTAAAITGQGDLATTNRATLGFGQQALTNTEFTISTTFPQTGWVAGYAGSTGGVLTTTIASGGARRAIKAVVAGSPANGTYFDAFYGPFGDAASARRQSLTVQPGDVVGASALLARNSSCSIADFVIYWQGSSGNYLGEAHSAQTVAVGNGDTGLAADYTLASVTATAPASAAFATVFSRAFCNGGATPTIWTMAPMLCRLPAGQTVVPPYSPGGPDRSADQTLSNTAAAVTGQGYWATAGALNVNGGASGAFTTAPIASSTSTSITMAACDWYNPFTSLSLPSATLSGLSPSTRYYVFRDITGATYIPESNYATARTYLTDNTSRYLYCGSAALPSSGGGPGGGGGGGFYP